MKRILTVLLAAFTLMACNQKKAEEAPAKPKALVLYYSQTGATKAVAEELQKQLGADIEAIEAEQPYDGDFQQTIERCQKEMAEGVFPTLKPIKANLDSVDIIFLGYPVWFGTYAPPVASLLKNQTFEGKKIVTFCTFGSGGLQASTNDVQKALPKANVICGYGVRNARIAAVADELNRFLIEGGYKEGTIDPLPAFMEHKPVTEQDIEIFNQACGDYQFPLGTPVDVAIRKTATSTDYEFGVKSMGPGGEEASTTIIVTQLKKEGSKPEFTQVVR